VLPARGPGDPGDGPGRDPRLDDQLARHARVDLRRGEHQLLPGDDVVDIIGIDNYDMGPSSRDAADFTRIAERPDGLTWTWNFAQAHAKPFSVGEWGVAPGSEFNTTGENPEFVRWMHDWFAAHAGTIAYEAYFNNCGAGVESNLYRPVSSACGRQNTAAGAVYQSLWGA
jgi:hypothetical protein